MMSSNKYMRCKLGFFLLCLVTQGIFAQTPLYEFVDFQKTLKIPTNLTSERSAVIFSVPHLDGEFSLAGSYEKMIEQSHAAFVAMGIDAIMYLNQIDYMAGKNSMDGYRSLFETRRVENIIFLTKTSSGSYQLLIASRSDSPFLISNQSEVFFWEGSELYPILLKLGKEIRRAELKQSNFLIPEKPSFLDGISIVEKTALKNYPGILRRSKLAVEKFSPLEIPKDTDSTSAMSIHKYNADVAIKNRELEQIMKTYPFEYELVESMTDEELIRQRFQYVLRSISGRAESIRRMLDYSVLPSETGFVSLIPLANEKTKTKLIPKNALVHKFFLKQTISKNIHVGEWDADTSWQNALKNLIGNLRNELDY